MYTLSLHDALPICERCAGFCFESRADAADQRGGLLRHGRRGYGGSRRLGDEDGNESSDGAAAAGGFYWAGCLCGHYGRAPGRTGRPEVSSLPFAEEICCCWLAGPQIRPRLL